MKFEINTVDKVITLLEPVKFEELQKCITANHWEEYTILGKTEYTCVPYVPYPTAPAWPVEPITPWPGYPRYPTYPIITWCSSDATMTTTNAIHT